MDVKVWMYLTYLAVSIGLTVWVARALARNGLVFLEDVFADKRLADAVNSLLVVGFYLLNLGYVTVAMKEAAPVRTTSQALEQLSMKVGWVLLVLGALHFFNVFALGRYRRGRLRQQAVGHPPLAPVGHLPAQPGARPAGPAPAGPAPGHPPAAGPAAPTGAPGPAAPFPTPPVPPR
ncbi:MULTISPECIES: hypothetical protein [Micromonospora]|uniref:Integral membrane protein n=1 Tax=Micromonospora solifontis TaxID=2487138 RepID=A0ABX9WME6_9ACTN|nr:MULTISPECIES: hypothetical protein [Micromonospora]NES14135.1 hypothetical protein [Micromonospora sp. PPF5-17B]NES35765.1 hypothetical protein [Micromonospora solifontis]NES55988.1 hypothetical protein [Micromonospora sp. PPF5-6]RNM00437.1 hypothetical protein EFE23_06245 [Micromonospora solifontis]